MDSLSAVIELGGALSLLASSINSPMNQAKLGIGLERMRQVPRNPIRSLMSPAPGRGLIRGGAYAGRNTEGLTIIIYVDI